MKIIKNNKYNKEINKKYKKQLDLKNIKINKFKYIFIIIIKINKIILKINQTIYINIYIFFLNKPIK